MSGLSPRNYYIRNNTTAAPPPALQVQMPNGDAITFNELSEVDEEELAAIGRQVTEVESNTPIAFAVGDPLAWPDALRSALFAVVASVVSGYSICLAGRDHPRFNTLFDFALQVAEGPADVERCGRSQRAAIEAAIICHPDSIDAAASRICERFSDLGVSLLQQTIRKALTNAVRQNGGSPGSVDPAALAAAFHDALRERVENATGRVVHNYQDDLYLFDGSIFKLVPPNLLQAMIVQTLQDQGVTRITGPVVSSVILNLKGQTLVDDWQQTLPIYFSSDNPPEIATSDDLVFENGIVNFSELLNEGTADLRQHDSRLFATVLLPYPYDPHAECHLWQETLHQIFPSTEEGDRRIENFQEFLGLTLIPGDLRYEKCLILDGPGANGKSTVLQVWKALLGKDNVSHVSVEQMGGEFRLISMQHKLANIAAELDRPSRINEALLKQLITGDPINVNRKNRDPMTMLPSARLIFATNSVPYFVDRSDGIFRRMILMPFLARFQGDNVDNHRAERLLDELPGIFNWAIAGAIRLRRQNRFTSCSVCDARLAQHRLDSDPFQQFLDEEVDLVADAQIFKQALYARFVEFCQASGRKSCCISEMGKSVLQLPGVTRGREGAGRRQHFYVGLRLRDPAVPQD